MRHWTDEQINRYSRRGVLVVVLVMGLVVGFDYLSQDPARRPPAETGSQAAVEPGVLLAEAPPPTTGGTVSTPSLPPGLWWAGGILSAPRPNPEGPVTDADGVEATTATTSSVPTADAAPTPTTAPATTAPTPTSTTSTTTTTSTTSTTSTTTPSTTTTTTTVVPGVFLARFDGSVDGEPDQWEAILHLEAGVTAGIPLGALVNLSWTGAGEGSGTYLTTGSGLLSVTLGPFAGESLTVRVDDLLLDGYEYQPESNLVPDLLILVAPKD